MAIQIVKENYHIYKHEYGISEPKFRQELSGLIIGKFGQGPFDNEDTVKGIISFSMEYYTNKFEEICQKEKSCSFYQYVYWLHEQVTEVVYSFPHQDLSENISMDYVRGYRRVLKFIMEAGCDVDMVSGEEIDPVFKQRASIVLNDLLILGDMILYCAENQAEQNIIEDVTSVVLDNAGLYVFSRKHHYELIINHVMSEYPMHIQNTIVDQSGFADFKEALLKYWGIDYDDVVFLIEEMYRQLIRQNGPNCGLDWNVYPTKLSEYKGVPLSVAQKFFKSLTLNRGNKMTLANLARKPYNVNRYLYKPIIIWNIDGNDYAFVGWNAWHSSIQLYTTDMIPWAKVPKEWKENKSFMTYVNRKEDLHDKWLDDAVEEKLNNRNLYFEKNVKRLKSKKGPGTNINIEGVGEIDFIILCTKTKKIFIADCKHLSPRYDVANQVNDYCAFVKGPDSKKSYNEKMADKLVWFNERKQLVEEHFNVKYNNNDIVLDEYIFEGIFITNTPTLYMYNAVYRIYTLGQIESVVVGEFEDPTFQFIKQQGDKQILHNIKYPYFQKPKYPSFELFED